MGGETLTFVQPDDISRKLCKAFNKIQLEDVAVSKGVNILRKLHENNENETSKFFNLFTHILKLPLSRGTSKDRLSSYEEKIFEVVCQFATSFLNKDKNNEGGEENNENKGKLF